jgi:non-ribosomal peptide synthetase component E (peptide arylation enzyme)
VNLAALLTERARRYASHTALHYDGRSERYTALESRARRSATRLRELGIETGDRMAVRLPRHVPLVESLPKGPTGKILKREIDVESPLERGE